MLEAVKFFWADYDAIKYGKTNLQFGDFEILEYSDENQEEAGRGQYFLQDSFWDTQ